MGRPIKTDAQALVVAMKVIKAQDNLLVAYRTGGRPTEKALNTLMRDKPRLESYLEERADGE